jgi:hypothetical protein
MVVVTLEHVPSKASRADKTREEGLSGPAQWRSMTIVTDQAAGLAVRPLAIYNFRW